MNRKITVIIAPTRSHGCSLVAKLLHFSGGELGDFIKTFEGDDPYEIFEHSKIYDESKDFIDFDPVVYNEPIEEYSDFDPFMGEAKDNLKEIIQQEYDRYGDAFIYKSSYGGRLLPLHKKALQELDIDPIFICLQRDRKKAYQSMRSKFYPKLDFNTYEKNYSQTNKIIYRLTEEDAILYVNFEDITGPNKIYTAEEIINFLQGEGLPFKHVDYIEDIFNIRFTGPNTVRPIIDEQAYKYRQLEIPNNYK